MLYSLHRRVLRVPHPGGHALSQLRHSLTHIWLHPHQTIPTPNASDSPGLNSFSGQYDSPELRDLSPTPTSVRPAIVTIIHPQLRDLVLPLERGRVLYPHLNVIEEQRWDILDEDDEVAQRPSHTNNLMKLNFTPTCLTSKDGILACGGQKGELFISNLPSTSGGKGKVSLNPFTINLTLPSRSINNAITILPSYPRGWAMRRAELKRAHLGYARWGEEMDEDTDDDETLDDDHDDDEYMDYLEEDDTEPLSPTSSVATYPNTIPFGTHRRMSHPRPQLVTQGGRLSQDSGPVSTRSTASTTSSRRRAHRPEEPRILVSNNDKTVKMFRLRRVDAEEDVRAPPSERERSVERGRVTSPPHGEGWESIAPTLSALRRTVEGADARFRLLESTLGGNFGLPPPRQLFGNPLGYDSIGLNEGILAQDLHSPPTPPLNEDAANADVSLRGTRYLGESGANYRSRNPSGAASILDDRRYGVARNALRAARTAQLERQIGLAPYDLTPATADDGGYKLCSVGGSKFRQAVNHSSFSPDLRTMVTVGDSTDVVLSEVVDGGTSFRRIATLRAATDSGFSTSWSKDGRRFAVASQDGQVTVWDHRSSRPLAIFHTQPQSPRYPDQEERTMEPPVGSQSGLEAARVVKFSPEGSSRDLLVFSEEMTRIHIVDARTFQTQLRIEVPFETESSPPSTRRQRRGVDGGLSGISGIAFDPTGDWLYAGTERTIVEWDLRRYGGGEGGTWSMA